jgi:hypothetical protein
MNTLRAYLMENGKWRMSLEAQANSPFSIFNSPLKERQPTFNF